jgi:AbrB family looped-hinge helix DNA binding protein
MYESRLIFRLSDYLQKMEQPMETVRVGSRGSVVIPAPTRRRLSIDEGTLLVLEERDGGILLRPGIVTLARSQAEPRDSSRSLLERKRDEILALAKRHGARNVRMFGSAARGEERPDSDLDLMVDLDRGRGLLDLIGLSQDLSELLGREVDVLTEEGLSPHLRDRIRAEAVPL